MKTIHNSKLYDTATEDNKTLYEIDHRSGEGNYSGTTYLILHPSGEFLLHTETNAQDLYFQDSLVVISRERALEFLEGEYPTDDQVAILLEEGLITEVGGER